MIEITKSRRQKSSNILLQNLAYSALNIDGLVQERINSIAYTLELRLFCTDPLICKYIYNAY